MAELELKELLLKLSDPVLAISEAENGYKKKIKEVGDIVISRKDVRVLLLAGPSGSGKTTTANLLRDEINGRGEECTVISLDDFYKDFDSESYPLTDKGDRDIESPLALDIEELHGVIGKIVGGEPFEVPRYDFKTGRRRGFTRYESYSDGCVIIEGIHGLNPILTDTLSGKGILKLFVSVSTNVNVDGRRIISGKKMRFLRRLVRDSIYRGQDALGTLKLWHGVLLGEELYLYPYKELADIKLDTFHAFEGAVMKPYAMKLLSDKRVADDPYARVVTDAISLIPEIDDSLVPEDSLIKEFIPGGIYEDLY